MSLVLAPGDRITATSVLIDANILIDIATEDPDWGEWSADALSRVGRSRRRVINPIIYAEVSVAFERIEDLDALAPADVFDREDPPWAAAFLAGKAFLAYRGHATERAENYARRLS